VQGVRLSLAGLQLIRKVISGNLDIGVKQQMKYGNWFVFKV
jgi:hypothetical protein